MPRRGNWGRSSEVTFTAGDSFRERSHGTGDSGTPCARGNRCEERDYAGNAQACPRAFCGTDERFIERAISGLPETYARLWLLLPPSAQGQERVSGSREPPVPLVTEVQAFLREIVCVALSWEDAVRAAAGLSDLPDGRRRDVAELQRAAAILTAHLTTLLSCSQTTVTRPASYSTVKGWGTGEEADLHLVRWDKALDAWEYVSMDGAAAGLEFLALSGRARGMLGLSRQRRRITEVPCDGCGSKTLIQREGIAGGWEPAVRCSDCPHMYSGDRLTLLMGRVYDAQVRALRHAA